MPLYLILSRPRNLGMGYRMFLGLLPTEAETPAEACHKNAPPEERDFLWANCLKQQWCAGTPEKPFVVNGGASDLCAVPLGTPPSLMLGLPAVEDQLHWWGDWGDKPVLNQGRKH